MRKKPIGVIVNMPDTEEGVAALREAIVEMNGRLIACGLRRVDAPAEEKRAFLRSLDGAVPWSEEGRRRMEAYTAGA